MNNLNVKIETTEGSPRVRLDRFLLLCPLCKRGFSRKSDLDNHKLCLNLTNRGDTNNNIKQEIKEEPRKLKKFSCLKCDEMFNRWSAFCRHSSFHRYLSVMEDSRRKDPSAISQVLWSENTTPLLKHEPPDNNDVLMDENFKTMKENKNIKSEQAKQPAMTFKGKRSADGKRLYSKACKICRRKFNHSGNLLVHQRVHSNERPYKCKFCNCRFKQLCHVNNHERLHSGETPWQCSLCGKQFHQKGNFDHHISKQH